MRVVVPLDGKTIVPGVDFKKAAPAGLEMFAECDSDRPKQFVGIRRKPDALAEIQQVSRELAELIGSISAQTQRQSSSVTDVTRGMQGILKISEETTEGTKQTNVSIGQLTKLAAELRSSVAGFKV